MLQNMKQNRTRGRVVQAIEEEGQGSWIIGFLEDWEGSCFGEWGPSSWSHDCETCNYVLVRRRRRRIICTQGVADGQTRGATWWQRNSGFWEVRSIHCHCENHETIRLRLLHGSEWVSVSQPLENQFGRQEGGAGLKVLTLGKILT